VTGGPTGNPLYTRQVRSIPWLALLFATPLLASPPPDAIVALSTTGPALQGEIPEAMPLRFVLLESGQVYVGGTSELATGRLEKKDVKALEKLIERVRKMPGLTTSAQTLGPGDRLFRLSLRKTGEVLAKGDPSRAPAASRPLAALIETLLMFDHASLRPHGADSFVLTAREWTLPGGCRDWRLPVGLNDVLQQPRVIAAPATAGWPTGGVPASVCAGDRRYAVTLRPLVPGETP
jgi:hypothetical protein